MGNALISLAGALKSWGGALISVTGGNMKSWGLEVLNPDLPQK